MKSIISIACLLLVASLAVEARPKRSVIYTSPVVAAAPVAVASVPVVSSAVVAHSHPTTVTKTEQVHTGDHSSYSYSTEVKQQHHHHHHPVVHTAVAAAPVVSHTVHAHAVPAHYYPSVAGYPHYAYASPYSYYFGK